MGYLYQNHMGGYFVDEEYLSYDELYCDSCGDSDDFICRFNDIDDVIDVLFEEEIDVHDSFHEDRLCKLFSDSSKGVLYIYEDDCFGWFFSWEKVDRDCYQLVGEAKGVGEAKRIMVGHVCGDGILDYVEDFCEN